MVRSIAVVLAVALLGASPPPSPDVSATDRVAELAGTWTCRKPSGYLSTVVYRAEGNGLTAVETGPSGRQVMKTTFAREPDGRWRVERTTPSERFTGYAPAWTGGAWVVADTRQNGSEMRYERIDDRTLKRTLNVPGRAPYNGDVCARGDAPPDPALCAVPDMPPTVLQAMEPDPPLGAMQSRIGGVVDVLVSLDAEGHVVDAKIAKSPNPVLNEASLAAARRSRYHPALHDCKPAPSTYTFSVDYMAN